MGVASTVQGALLRLHQTLYERTDGRVGHGMILVPTLLLRTTGRRSGAPRCNALVYAKDGTDYVVVASNGGREQAPGWFHNARAKPQVEIQVGRTRRSGAARVIERGDDDFERLWQLVNDNNHARYDAYQAQAARPIPLLVVSPT